MKKCCSICKQEKNVKAFAFKNTSKDTRQSQCNPCRRAKAKVHYRQNRQRAIDRSIRNGRKKALKFKKFKQTLECIYCGETDTCTFDFHHVEEKVFEVNAYVIARKSWETVVEELKKCVCLCASCHRKVHGGTISIDESQRVNGSILLNKAPVV